MAINNATNAGLLAVRLLASSHPLYRQRLNAYRLAQEEKVMAAVEKMGKVKF